MVRSRLLKTAHIAALATILMAQASAAEGRELADDQIEVAGSATPAQAKVARDFFRKHGNGRFFGYSNFQPKILHLLDPKLDDRAIAPLQYLAGLEELYIAGIPISDDGLRTLAGLRELKSLTLSGPVRSGSATEIPAVTMKLNGSGLKWVAQLPQLEELWLHRLPVDAKHLSVLASATKLREIWMSLVVADGSLPTLDSRLLALREVPNLELLRVTVRGNVAQHASADRKPLHKVSQPLFANWKSEATLRQVVLSGVELDSKAWSSLQTLRSLESLDYRVHTSVIDWATLSKLPNLKEVRLANVDDEALDGIEKCPQIRSLSLEFSITDKGLERLTDMQHLQSLTLWHCPITGRAIKNCERMRSLRTLRLTGTQLDDRGLKELSRLPALQSLDLEDTRVTPNGLNLLANIKTLRTVVPPIPWEDSGTGRSDAETLRVIEELRKRAPRIEFKLMLDAPP